MAPGIERQPLLHQELLLLEHGVRVFGCCNIVVEVAFGRELFLLRIKRFSVSHEILLDLLKSFAFRLGKKEVEEYGSCAEVETCLASSLAW